MLLRGYKNGKLERMRRCGGVVSEWGGGKELNSRFHSGKLLDNA